MNEFVRILETKLAVTTFRTDEDGMQCVLSLLEGPAWRLCAPRVPSNMAGHPCHCHNPFKNAEDMISESIKRFGQANTEGGALAAMRQLREGPNPTFSSLHARFLEYRSQLPFFTDAMEIDTLQGMLNEFGKRGHHCLSASSGGAQRDK